MTGHRLRVEWHALLVGFVSVLLFVPSRRYVFPVGLPFEVDGFRVTLVVLLILLVLTLLASDQPMLRKSGLDAPLGLLLIAVAGSLAANTARVSLYHSEVIGAVATTLGFLLAFYLTVTVLRRLDAVEAVLTALVVGGTIIAVFAVIESRTGWSPFVGLDRYVPLLRATDGGGGLLRDGRFRALGPAEHPIALGAVLAVLAPIAAGLAVSRRSLFWSGSLALLVIGSLSTLSRTPFLMLLVGFAFFAALRWSDVKRFAPLALIALALTHFFLPGALGSLRGALQFDRVVAEQTQNADSLSSAGRIADLGPSFEEFRLKPVLGYGIGTRVVTGEKANARILDNQWLGSLLDMGIVGIIALAWLFLRFIGRMVSASATQPAQQAVMLVALASSVLMYAVSMFTYDALAFNQVTVVLFLILAAGSALVLADDPVLVAQTSGEPRASALTVSS